jgi:aminoglycoside phosphotransferase (APT) family kinase protein
MTLRLPGAARYVPSVEKEQTWLPRLAPADAHCFHRGGSLAVYDARPARPSPCSGPGSTAPPPTEVWETALTATWTGAPVWFHGDIAYGNVRVDCTGRLAAVIDFGT